MNLTQRQFDMMVAAINKDNEKQIKAYSDSEEDTHRSPANRTGSPQTASKRKHVNKYAELNKTAQKPHITGSFLKDAVAGMPGVTISPKAMKALEKIQKKQRDNQDDKTE